MDCPLCHAVAHDVTTFEEAGEKRVYVCSNENCGNRHIVLLSAIDINLPLPVQESMRIEAQFCEHMKALVRYCRENKVEFGGCGDCGSAWLTCEVCDFTVDEAHRVFEIGYPIGGE